jgi:hypothetical protein
MGKKRLFRINRLQKAKITPFRAILDEENLPGRGFVGEDKTGEKRSRCVIILAP